MIDFKTLISDNFSKVGLLIFTIFYLIITVLLVNENSTLVLLFYVFGSLFLYLIKPSISFVFTLLALIEPIGRISFGRITIIFIVLSCLHVFFNILKYWNLIKQDKIFRMILMNAIFFMFYQLFFTFVETDGSSYKNYLLLNIKLVLGVWVILPAYYFAITDRKNFFFSILILSVLTFIYFYISKAGIYEFFRMVEQDRGMDKDLTRINIGFDIRYLVKIFAYFLPAIFLFDLIMGKLKKILIIDGLMAFGVLVLSLLRLDLIYTVFGGLLAVYFLNRNYGIENKSNKIMKTILIFIVLFVVFFSQIQQVIDTYLLTAGSLSGKNSDSSLDMRMEWIPLLMPYIEDYILFGVGFFTLSYDNLDVYAAADMPLFASMAIYGLVGFLIYLFRYIYIFKAFKNVNISKELYNEYKLEVILLYGIACFFITALSFKLYLIFAELIYGWAYIEFSVLMGIFMGLKRFFEIKSEQLNEGIDENYIKEEI